MEIELRYIESCIKEYESSRKINLGFIAEKMKEYAKEVNKPILEIDIESGNLKLEIELPENYIEALNQFKDENGCNDLNEAALEALKDHLLERYSINDTID